MYCLESHTEHCCRCSKEMMLIKSCLDPISWVSLWLHQKLCLIWELHDWVWWFLESFGWKWPREPDHTLLQTLWFTQSQNLLFWLGPSRLLVLQMLTANELVSHVLFEWVIRFYMEWNLLQQFMFSESLGDQKNLLYMECFRIVKILIDGYFVNFFKSWFNLIMISINSLS